MKAVVYTAPGEVETQELTKPILPRNEILVKVAYCAVCGTDAGVVFNGMFDVKPPMIVGHEMSGVVVEIGEDVPEGMFRVGDHVCANPVPHCGSCVYCRKGQYAHCINAPFERTERPLEAMAEYRSYPPEQLFRVSDDVPLKHACLVEPITTACRGIQQARMSFGATVCVSGAGSMGLIMLELLRNHGATRLTVIEPVEEKRALALELGAEHVIDPNAQDVLSAAMEITEGQGFDFVFEMSGAKSAAELALELVAPCGCVEYFAIHSDQYRLPVNMFDMFNKEARIQFTFTDPTLYPRTIDLLRRLDLDKITGPEYSIDEAKQAFADFKTAKYPKLVVRCAEDI